jgi:hypothetical protein
VFPCRPVGPVLPCGPVGPWNVVALCQIVSKSIIAVGVVLSS